ncbi:hypothetical protein MNVI_06620 [Mycobacterium noviomagense]|uniref:Uncharacterized protein n=1 Tax=Mycobacterium noviomagense TaxID=459858 RepID=A0A7I7P9U7_9MYCO|nr:hypothetical protein MNVI_06620 [Mycobacterium noviomagense]
MSAVAELVGRLRRARPGGVDRQCGNVIGRRGNDTVARAASAGFGAANAEPMRCIVPAVPLDGAGCVVTKDIAPS